MLAYDRWLFDYAEAWLAAEKKAGRHAILGDIQSLLMERMNHWKAVARRMLTRYRAELQRVKKQAEPSLAGNSRKTAQTAEGKPTNGPDRPTSWRDIEIAFLSDERVEICCGSERKTYHYNEFGFEDRRDGKPSLAWGMLPSP